MTALNVDSGSHIEQSGPTDLSPSVLELDSSRGSGLYRVCTSAELQQGTPSAQHALVMIHGRLRNASDYFNTGLELVSTAGVSPDTVVVTAPQLLDQSDIAKYNLSTQYLCWNEDWEGGMPAVAPSPASSYDVLDDLVVKLSNASAFPKLQRIVFVGHGGGAQLLARYAVVMRPASSKSISFVIANPGTYLYLTPNRPLAIPTDCDSYDTWKYGLNSLPPYAGGRSRSDILKDFATRDITLLLGTRDLDSHGILDQSCPAVCQGPNRFERGKYFLDQLAKSGVASQVQHSFVDGVGHDELPMLTSQPALAAIFPDRAAVH